MLLLCDSDTATTNRGGVVSQHAYQASPPLVGQWNFSLENLTVHAFKLP
jgi:hypothetical protein